MRYSNLLSLLALAAAADATTPASIKNLKDKIKNVVVLVMENRSVDNLLGGQKIAGLDVPITSAKPICNPYNLTNPHAGQACAEASDYNEVIDDPDHSVYGNNIEFFGEFDPTAAQTHATPKMQGFIHEQVRSYGAKANSSFLAKQVMNYYTEEQVAVLTSLVKNFVTFGNWHGDIPGPTNPNRVAIHSGTSNGHGSNNFNYGTMPQRSIFQELSEQNRTWKNYAVDSSEEDALWFEWTYTSGNTGLVVPIDDFYTDAAAGTLPELSVIGPSCCGVGTSSMHPQGLVSDGEIFIKKAYESLRASPQWHQSLFIITFDETGGFHDHVPPPNAPRPDNLTFTSTTPSGQNYTFDFDRLGGRLPTFAISPWVKSGYVEQQGVNSKGETVSYCASSILRTLGYLWDFEPFTARVNWAPSFDCLIQENFRMNTPKKLADVNPW